MRTLRLREFARRSLATCLLLAMALPAAAQWTGKGEAGLAIADGNSNTKSANARIAIGRKVESWEHALGLAWLYVRNNGVTSAKRWESFAKTQYNFGGGRTFWFGGARYEEDRFS